jgi:hypothetical protein
VRRILIVRGIPLYNRWSDISGPLPFLHASIERDWFQTACSYTSCATKVPCLVNGKWYLEPSIGNLTDKNYVDNKHTTIQITRHDFDATARDTTKVIIRNNHIWTWSGWVCKWNKCEISHFGVICFISCTSITIKLLYKCTHAVA